ncbi:MAG: amino acid--tRNA ligase-related protein [Acidimicrobiia bacterium]|nr:amino acid--tRNA ligase-related protein [Acidimicrobiia bacterium]
MTWHEAMDRFGSDKPDLRFGLELVELTELFADTGFQAFRAPCVKGIRLPGGAELSRNRLDDLTDRAKQWGAKGLVWMQGRAPDGVARLPGGQVPLRRGAGRDRRAPSVPRRATCCCSSPTARQLVRHVLGLLRLELGRPPVYEGGLHFVWVVDFPLFEDLDESGLPYPAHHPFTMPHPDDLGPAATRRCRRSERLLDVRSQAYDLVLNGWELGSGSVRIHEPEIQSLVFEVLGISEDEARRKFGFLLDAFGYGAPPHAGFAFGIDRLVAILAGEDNIREVIAFPKTQSGGDPLTGAPRPRSMPPHLDELGLRLLPRT